MQQEIYFLLPSLDMGGAEKVTIKLVNQLSREKFRVRVILHRTGGILSDSLLKDVAVINLDVKKNRYAWLPLLLFLIRKKPALVISVMDASSINLLFASTISRLVGIKLKTICISHIAIAHVRLSLIKFELYKFLVNRLFPLADALVVISEKAKADYVALFPVLRGRVRVIYNSAIDDSITEQSMEEVDHPFFTSKKPVLVNCGRLIDQKGINYLLQGFCLIRKDVDCKLIIIGDGPERCRLEKLSIELGLNDHVSFMGMLQNPYPYMRKAELYVHAALWDGLPTVLVEALACGCAIVSTDCPAGPSEIIEHNKSGFLVKKLADPQVLAEAVTYLFSHPEIMASFRRNAPLRARLFHCTTIVPRYEALIEEVLHR